MDRQTQAGTRVGNHQGHAHCGAMPLHQIAGHPTPKVRTQAGPKSTRNSRKHPKQPTASHSSDSNIKSSTRLHRDSVCLRWLSAVLPACFYMLSTVALCHTTCTVTLGKYITGAGRPHPHMGGRIHSLHPRCKALHRHHYHAPARHSDSDDDGLAHVNR